MLRASLAAQGWARNVGPWADGLSRLVARAGVLGWSPLAGEGFSLEVADVALADLARPAGGPTMRLVRHRPGDHGLPPIDGEVGFVLDLNDGWPSHHGGLLLFSEGEAVRGWRPERGALTAFDAARPPVLTLVVPGAGDRLAVIGTLT